MAARSSARSFRFFTGLFCSPVFIAGVALVLRLLILVARRGAADLSTPYINETTSVAASIATNHGFASPLPLAATGPTAWLSPIFPYSVAGIFRLFGVFSATSLATIQCANCVFASLTIFPIYGVARRSFDSVTASLAAWLWVFLPFAWWTPIQDIWDTALTGFLLASIVWATLAVRHSKRLVAWVGYGALGAIAALVNAATVSVLALSFLWLAWPARNLRIPKRFPSAAVLACALLLLPWTIRNHHVFGKWIPLRSNFGLELWLGNNPEAGEVNSFELHPLWNRAEAEQFQREGEIAYFAEKQHEALAYMSSNPGATLHFMLGRVWLNWFAVTDRPRTRWSALPPYVKTLFLANFLMIVLSGLALVLLVRASLFEAMPYLIVFLAFPLPYYVTHTLVRYRFPVEPILTVLSVYGALQVWDWMAAELRSHAASKPAPVLGTAR